MHDCFEVTSDGLVAHIRLSRPDKRNSMIAAFWTELYSIVDSIDREAKARAVVITSTGPHFSSGMDVSVFKSLCDKNQSNASDQSDERAQLSSVADLSSSELDAQQAAKFYQTVTRLQRTFTRLEQCRVPVLVAIQGGCIGAGLDLITACDCRYATRDAYFTLYETRLAITADVGTFPRICKLMPDGLVRELAYTGRSLSADEAVSSGLINQVYETQEQLVDSVMDIAQSIARNAPMAVHGCKQMILHARDHRVSDTLDHVALWNSGFMQRREIAEAMAANAEKRNGNFSRLPVLPDDDTEAGIEL